MPLFLDVEFHTVLSIYSNASQKRLIKFLFFRSAFRGIVSSKLELLKIVLIFSLNLKESFIISLSSKMMGSRSVLNENEI